MDKNYSLRRLVSRKEDHLTAVFALALELDETLREAVAGLLLAELPRVDGVAPRINAIEMQRPFGNACPDLVFTLEDGRLVLVENKIEAPETFGTMEAGTATEADTIAGPIKAAQLKRYMNLPGVTALAFIRATRKQVDATLLTDARYLRPAGGQHHFLWRDLYPLMVGATHPVTAWLRDAFETCDFTPPTDAVGDLTDPERRRNMRKLLEPAADYARTLGWTVSAGSIAELCLERHPTSPVDLVWVNPTTERLVVRLRPRLPEHLQTLWKAAILAEASLRTDFPVEVSQVRVAQTAGPRDVLNLSVTMSGAIGEATSAAALQDRFKRFLEPIVRSVSPDVPV